MKDQTVRNFRHEESALRDKLIKSVGFVLFCVHLEERQLRSWGGRTGNPHAMQSQFIAIQATEHVPSLTTNAQMSEKPVPSKLDQFSEILRR